MKPDYVRVFRFIMDKINQMDYNTNGKKITIGDAAMDDIKSGPRFSDSVKVRIVGRRAFFGPGPYRLLCAVKECGTVSGACEMTGISYSKGRTLIKNMEQELGCPLVERTPGGNGGGSARVTEAGDEFLNRYSAYAQAVSSYADSIFPEYFPDLEKQK